jgi:hypothetical protein
MLPILGAVTFVLILAAILIPGQIASRVARDEARAMESLQALTDLELRYATAHPSKRFTLEFALLKTEAPSNGEQIHEGFLFSIRLTVSNSHLPDAKSSRGDWPLDIKQLQCLSPGKNTCSRLVYRPNKRTSLGRKVSSQRVADRCRLTCLMNAVTGEVPPREGPRSRTKDRAPGVTSSISRILRKSKLRWLKLRQQRGDVANSAVSRVTIEALGKMPDFSAY